MLDAAVCLRAFVRAQVPVHDAERERAALRRRRRRTGARRGARTPRAHAQARVVGPAQDWLWGGPDAFLSLVGRPFPGLQVRPPRAPAVRARVSVGECVGDMH